MKSSQFQKAVKITLIHKDISAKELSRNLGFNDQWLNILINRNNNITLNNMNKIALALNISLSKLVALGESL